MRKNIIYNTLCNKNYVNRKRGANIMGKIMETPDGLDHVITDEEDVIDLIRDYAGVDAADYVEGLLEELREEIERAEDAVQDLEEAYNLINNGETKAELYLYLGTIEGCKL